MSDNKKYSEAKMDGNEVQMNLPVVIGINKY